MKKDNKKRERLYTTMDSYQAGFLTLREHIPELLEEGNKIIFAFAATQELYNDLSAYNAGAMVEASRFAGAIKNLKSQIHSLRRNNGKWVGTREGESVNQ